jgi:hypothetical protein
MTQSESIDKLYPAFIAFQAEVPSVLKDGNNPHFKSKYATLPAITESVRPYLAKHGLGFTQSLAYRDGVQLIFTRVMHTSGQWMEDEGYVLNPTKNDPQGMASAVTYARRNTLGATCGIVTEDDDDGNAASAPRPQPAKQPATDLPPLNATNADGTLNSKGLESASFIAGGGTFEQIERKYKFSKAERMAVDNEAVRMRMDATDKTKQGNASQLIAQADEIGDGLPWD